MEFSPKNLGELLDSWASTTRATIVETSVAITVSGIARNDVVELSRALEQSGWDYGVVDGALNPIGVDELDPDMGPFIATITKPTATLCFVTCVGFESSLNNDSITGVCQLARASVSFATGLAVFCPWGSGELFSPSDSTKSPLDLVREGSESRLVPADIRKWLLRTHISEELWSDPAFEIFARVSAPALVRSIASEVVGRSTVVFSGPPRLNIGISEPTAPMAIQLAGFKALQSVVGWVYEDRSSAEQRHALFAAEFARTVSHRDSIWNAIAETGKDVLAGARLAFALSQSDLSREAIKAQSDLRKSIAEDMAKAAESTRTLATAIAVAIATGIGLVAARSTSSAEPWVLTAVAAIIAVYLFVVAISGWLYLRLQKRLRAQWRQRFYRFVPEDDYAAMVTEPAQAATVPYHLVGGIAVLISIVLLLVAVMGDAGPAPAQESSISSYALGFRTCETAG